MTFADQISNLVAQARENGLPVSVSSRTGKTYYNIVSIETSDHGWMKLISSAEGKDSEVIFVPFDIVADIIVATSSQPNLHAI